MDADAIVERARILGVTLTVAGDRIRYVPASRTPNDLVEALRKHKSEVLNCLSKQPGSYSLPNLLAWACELAEQDSVLPDPVSFVEAKLRTVTTRDVSHYATRHLSTITYAKLQEQNGGWGMFTSTWWRDREHDSVVALQNLRQALDGTRGTDP